MVRAQGGWLPPGPPSLSLHAMPHRIPTRALWFAVALLTGGSAFLPVAAQGRCAPAPTALVLSGGGAKGLAHVGVLRALERAGIRPDLIVGSSMGSVVGALAASGYSAASIDSIARALPLAEVFRTHEPRGPAAWGARLPLLLWEEGEQGFAIQGASVEQRAIGGMLGEVLLRGNLLARGDFDRLPIPLRVVATNLADRGITPFASGDLARAVRASIAIPLVFTPQRIGDSVYADGGLSANIPVEVARRAGARRVIVSDVTELPSDTLNLESPFVVADRLLNWLFRQPDAELDATDLMIRSPIGAFRALDFSPGAIDALIALGERTADSALAAWRCRPEGAATTPPLGRLPAVVRVVDGPSADRAAVLQVRRALGLERTAPVDVALLGRRLARLADRELFKEVWLNPTGRGDTVLLQPTLTRLPRRVGGIGLSYDAELGGRLWAGVLDRHLPLLGTEASGVLTLNRFASSLEVTARRETRLGQSPFTPIARIDLRDTDMRRFGLDGLELPATQVLTARSEVGLERQLALGFRLSLLAAHESWRERDLVDERRLTRSTVGGAIHLQRLGLDREELANVEVRVTEAYSRAAAVIRFNGAFGGFRLEPRVRLGVGHDLPANMVFTLGGADGFPGLHLGERPGDNEALVSLTLTRPLIGPIRLRIGGAWGRTAFGETSFLTPNGDVRPDRILPGAYTAGRWFGPEGWLVGARVGVGSDTPIGPVRLEYGVNDAGRKVVFLRVGRW